MMWARSLTLKTRLEKLDFWREISHFSGFYVREEEGEKESIQAFFWRSLEFHRLEFIKPRTKIHRLDEGYAFVPKTRGFTED